MTLSLAHIRPDVAALIECVLAVIVIAAVWYTLARLGLEIYLQVQAARRLQPSALPQLSAAPAAPLAGLPPARPLPNICANRLQSSHAAPAVTQPPHSGCGTGSACLGHPNCADHHCPGRPSHRPNKQ